jgi:3-mercaptopyruvate sulfurtransferase SseA
MSSSLLVTLEIFGVLGVVLLLGGWELWQLRKDKKQNSNGQKGDKP